MNSTQEIEPVVSETKWFYWTSPKAADVKVKYRMVDRTLESETEIRINATCARITSVILQSDLRKLWDLRVSSCEFNPTPDPTLFDLVIKMDIRGSIQNFTGPCRVTQESDQKTMVSFEALKGTLRTLYEITTVSRSGSKVISSISTQEIQKLDDLELDPAECSTPTLSPPSPESTEPQGDQCLVVVSVFMSDSTSKFFITDLLGEDEKLLTTWSRFKSVAEGGVVEIEEGKGESLHNAVSRKALLSFNSQRKRTEDAEDLHRLSTRRLERRMFLS